MQTICLFGGDYATAAQVHQALKNLLRLPAYYGMNADALNDCLSEYSCCPSLWVHLSGSDEVVSCLQLVARVFRDNGADVKEL